MRVLGPADQETTAAIPLFLERISAGFPSPADGHVFEQIDIHDYLVRNPVATYFMRADGDGLLESGIRPGDILVVDKSELPAPGKIVVFALNGGFSIRRLVRWQGQFQLVADNPKYKPLIISDLSTFEAWGVVVGLARML